MSTVLGVAPGRVRKWLSRCPAYPADAQGRYDPRALDLLRAIRGLPHRALEPVDSDWLARYLEENT